MRVTIIISTYVYILYIYVLINMFVTYCFFVYFVSFHYMFTPKVQQNKTLHHYILYVVTHYVYLCFMKTHTCMKYTLRHVLPETSSRQTSQTQTLSSPFVEARIHTVGCQRWVT